MISGGLSPAGWGRWADGVALRKRDAHIQKVRCGLAKRPRSLAPFTLYDGRGSCVPGITTPSEYIRHERNAASCDSGGLFAMDLTTRNSKNGVVCTRYMAR
jgi:hypothetical protein